MQRMLIAPLPVALATVVIATACGSDDGSNGSEGSAAAGASNGSKSSSGSSDGSEDTWEVSDEPIATSSLSKAQFIERANAICRRNRKERIEAATAYGEQNADQAQEESIIGGIKEVLVPAMKARLAKLRELGAPQGDEKQVEAIIVANERAVEALEALEDLGPTRYIDRESGRAEARARKYGLAECATS